MKNLLPLSADEVAAIIALALGLVFNDIPFFSGIAVLATIYLFMCAGFRKYEIILKRNKK
jgi:hypothetical protein